jgi:hypothetical protein
MYAVALCALSAEVASAQDLKVSQLEQDVRELQQQVQRQSRRIDVLEGELNLSRGTAPLPDRATVVVQNTTQPWLKSGSWDQIKRGMSESEVIQVLGPPTTTRSPGDGRQRTLFYALELGAGSFLSGQVLIESAKVTSVQKPTLK